MCNKNKAISTTNLKLITYTTYKKNKYQAL